MVYVKYCESAYIVGVGRLNTDCQTGEIITEREYEYLREILLTRPSAPDGFAYRLTAELEWELYEVPIEEQELTETEEKALAYDILTGVAE